MLGKKDTTRADTTKRSVQNSSTTLLANIRFMRVDDPIRTVVVTSAIPNEGKTFVAANLAVAMATSGIRTLVVEADMRRRSMARILNAHAKNGVYSVLSGEMELEDAVVPTKTKHLYFLDSEPHIPNPSDLINSNRYSELIETAKSKYGYIVFDTPPVGTFVDAAVLGKKVDAVFMVIRENFTRRDEVARAAEQLKTADVSLSGLVMNYCERQSNEYYYEYYYREDKNSSRADAPKLSRKKSESHLKSKDQSGTVDTEYQSRAKKSEAKKPRSWSNAPDLD